MANQDMKSHEEIIDSLTDEERAVLEEEGDANEVPTEQDDGDAAAAALAAKASTGKTVIDDTGAEGEEAETDEVDPAAAKADEAAGRDDGKTSEEAEAKTAEELAAEAEAAAAKAEEKPAPAPTPTPILVVPAPEGADEKLKQIDADKKSLIAQFDDGDITAAEYQSKLDTLNREERKIEREVDAHQMAVKMEDQRLKNDWISTVQGFLATPGNERYNTNKHLYNALDQEVREIAKAEPNLTGAAILAKANANLATAFGFDAKTEKPVVPKAETPAKKDLKLPPTLAKTPSAEANETSGNKYAALDRLQQSDPIKYEAEVAKMSDAERDAYMAA